MLINLLLKLAGLLQCLIFFGSFDGSLIAAPKEFLGKLHILKVSDVSLS